MASWIVHLRIAESLLQTISGLEPLAFTVGSVAPDSGIPDENWENFNPPPQVTHFIPNPAGLYRSGDSAFFQSYLKNLPWPGVSPRQFSFRLGYFLHLITDNLWHIEIYLPTQQRFESQFPDKRSFINEIKGDWYGLDHVYVRDHPDSIFWRLFTTCQWPDEDLDFMPPGAVQQRLDYIKQFYTTIDDEVLAAYSRPYRYLSQVEMDQFVKMAAQRCARVFNLLWNQHIELRDHVSALQLLTEPTEVV